MLPSAPAGRGLAIDARGRGESYVLEGGPIDGAPAAAFHQSVVAGALATSTRWNVPWTGRGAPAATLPSQSGPAESVPAVASPRKTMREIVARIALEDDEPLAAGDAMRRLIESHAGVITKDEVTRNAGADEVHLEVRVPAENAEAMLTNVGKMGRLVGRDVTALDITKQFHDTELLLRNLELTMKKYEELLARASEMKDVLLIEAKIADLRGQIERAKADILWLRDRDARATFVIVIRGADRTAMPNSTTIFPSLYGAAMWDLRSAGGRLAGAGYVGGGAQVRVKAIASRGLVLDFGAFDASFGRAPNSGRSAWYALSGADMYSSFFGGGQRRWLNPFFGLRLGAGRLERTADIPFGGVFGIDLYKGSMFVLDVQVQGLVMPVNESATVLGRIGAGFAF